MGMKSIKIRNSIISLKKGDLENAVKTLNAKAEEVVAINLSTSAIRKIRIESKETNPKIGVSYNEFTLTKKGNNYHVSIPHEPTILFEIYSEWKVAEIRKKDFVTLGITANLNNNNSKIELYSL